MFLDNRTTLEIGWLVRFAGATILRVSSRSREPASVTGVGVCQPHPFSEENNHRSASLGFIWPKQGDLLAQNPGFVPFGISGCVHIRSCCC